MTYFLWAVFAGFPYWTTGDHHEYPTEQACIEQRDFEWKAEDNKGQMIAIMCLPDGVRPNGTNVKWRIVRDGKS